VDCRADLLNQRAAFKIELSHLTGGGADQAAAAEGYHTYQLGKTIALTTLHDLTNLPHITISTQLVEEQNATHKPITWQDHVSTFAYTPIPGLDARVVTSELKLRLKLYCSRTWWVFYIVFCLFVILLWGVLFYSYFLFSFHTINFTITIFSSLLSPLHSPPSPVLKSIAFLSSYSFCPFLSTLSCPHLPLPFSSNLLPDYPFLLHTHHLQTNLLYQLYTTPTLCNP
jgi:hypothetical protein